MSDKIDLEVGVAVTVAFKYDVGRLCEKKWPGAEDRYARQTFDGRVMFFDADQEMRLRKACRAGVEVILTLEKTRSGSKYMTIKTPAAQLKGPVAVVHGRQIPDAKYAAPEVNWGGMTVELTPTVVSGPTASLTSGEGGLLGRCLIEALDACKAAQAHATSIGLPTTFSSGDIERMGVSIFIERTRNGSAVERKPAGRQEGSGYVNGFAH
jgi:hypothetical protein